MPLAGERRALRAIVDTLAPASSDRAAVAGDVESALERLAPHRRAQLLQFLRLLEVPAFVYAAAGRAGRFSREPRSEREAILRRLADHPFAPLRTGFNAFKRLVLFIAYARDAAPAGNPLWKHIGYPGPRGDVPQDVPRLSLATPRAGRMSADVIVIGSGAGGGVAAAAFASAGHRTIVLEAGPPADEISATQQEALAVSSLYLESGLSASTDLSVAILAGACVGGGTTINWSTSLRLRDAAAQQWAHGAGVPSLHSELRTAYDAVERRLRLETAPAHNRNNAVIARGCERLGWNCATIPRNASGCAEGCGYCGFGCAYGNKRSTAATYLRDAVAAGAQVYANVRAERVHIERGRTRGVEATIAGEAGGGMLRIDAPLVVVAAGALRTPGLLARSGVRSRHLGRHLRLHPVGALSAEFDEPVEPWTGPIQSALCDRYADVDDGYGVAIECAPAHPGLAGLALPWRSAEQHEGEMLRFRNAAVLIALVRDRGAGSVSLDGRDDVRYAIGAFDAGHLMQGVVAAATIALAAGARRVLTFHADPIVLERDAAGSGGLRDFAASVHSRGTASNRAIFFSAHQMGTARMNADSREGVVDAYGAVHGVEGLLVADASAFPLASGVNPMLTVMALAHRTAAHHIGLRRSGPSTHASSAG